MKRQVAFERALVGVWSIGIASCGIAHCTARRAVPFAALSLDI